MSSHVDDFFARALAAWVDFARRRAGLVIATTAILTLVAAGLAATRLGIDSDNVRLIAEDLPSRRNYEAFAAVFPNLENALLVVIDGATPELARAAERKLVARLDADPEHFTDAYPAAGGAFFETHGLLYRSLDELDTFAIEIARLQPVLAELDRDPSVANLAELVASGLTEIAHGNASGLPPDDWAQILDSVSQATVAVYSEFPLALSWEQLLLQGSAIDVGTRRVVVVHPLLDFRSFLAAGRALERIRGIAAEESLDDAHGVRVRITGNPALNYEEMIGLAWDIGAGSLFCFALVVLVLLRALRSLRLVLATVVTLLVGLVWTSAFAAVAVGHLNLVSAAFALLFIGLGVDFGIHFGMAYAASLRSGGAHETALREATTGVGGSLVLCVATTAIGFFVFVPTDYRGVAELGLIAGSGMLIIVLLTFTLTPALLTKAFCVDPSEIHRELHFRTTWWRVFDRFPRAVVAVAALLFAGSLALLPRARFDVNVIEMRDPTTESVQAFDDLLAQSGALSPWYINSVVASLDAVPARAAEFMALDSVSHTLALTDYVPADQAEKISILSDLGYLLDTPPAMPDEPRETGLDEQVAALRALHDLLGRMQPDESPGELRQSVTLLQEKLGSFLERIDRDEDPAAAIAKLDEILLAGFPAQIRRLERAIETEPITLADLPPEIVERMVAPDGRTRIQVFPKHDLSDEVAFTRFTEDVLRIDPEAASVAINLVGFGQATRSSFRQAMISAVVLISVLLLAIWRSPRPIVLVLLPLALASLMTVAAMVLLDIPFNFANVVVVPLLLGIGVDSGIHLVHRAELTEDPRDDLMDSTTARAVFYSALTTLISFGTLAFSSHRGVAGLGIVLSIGMTLTVLANLVVLPALIRVVGARRRGPATQAGAGTR